MRVVMQALLIGLMSMLVTGCNSNKSAMDKIQDEKNLNAAQINTRLGLAYLQRQDIQRAKQKFLLALELAPKTPEPWYAMGYFQQATGHNEEAKKYYLKAIEVAPGRGEALNNYGTYLCRNNDYNGAIKQFTAAVKDPKYLDTAAAYENAGLCALKIPDKQLALSYFTKALNEDPNRTTALIESAELNYHLGNYKLARFNLSRYLEFGTPNAESYDLEKKLETKIEMTG